MLKIYFIGRESFSLKSIGIIVYNVIVSYWQQMEFYKSKSSTFQSGFLCLCDSWGRVGRYCLIGMKLDSTAGQHLEGVFTTCQFFLKASMLSKYKGF